LIPVLGLTSCRFRLAGAFRDSVFLITDVRANVVIEPEPIDRFRVRAPDRATIPSDIALKTDNRDGCSDDTAGRRSGKFTTGSSKRAAWAASTCHSRMLSGAG
jgi:hypothetical protein